MNNHHHTPITENNNNNNKTEKPRSVGPHKSKLEKTTSKKTLGLYDVLCGRDKDAYHHVGNRRFRVMINLNLSRYVACQSRYEKGTLISSLTEELMDVTSSCAVRFMKRVQDDDDTGNSSLTELDVEQSREKVAHSLRDAVTQQNKKNEKRKENNKKKETDDDGSLSPSTCTINRTPHTTTTTTTTKPPVIKMRATTESTSESALMTPALAEALSDLITPIIRDYSDAPAPAPAPASPNYNRRVSDPVPASTALAPAQPDRRNCMFKLGQDEKLIRELSQSLTYLCDSFNSNHIYDYNCDYNHSGNGYGYDNNGHENNDNNNGKQHNHTTDYNHDAATLAPSRQQQQRKRRSMLVFQEFAETEEEQHSRNPKTRLADCFNGDDDDDYSHDHHMNDNDNDNDEEGANELTFFSSRLEELERLSSKIGHHSASASAAPTSASASTSDSIQYRFGDITKNIVARGGQVDGREENSGYKFGDFTRGLFR